MWVDGAWVPGGVVVASLSWRPTSEGALSRSENARESSLSLTECLGFISQS